MIADRITDLVLARDEPPLAIVVSPRVLRNLKCELPRWGIWAVDHPNDMTFLGVPVRTKRYTQFCAGCGAPAERGPCSYCGRDPDEIEVE